jgi:Domain of unknown function (DUF2341)/Secretion system C-terminal sorting domain
MKKTLTFLSLLFSFAAFATPIGWSYGVPITVTNNTATQAVNYQARITFDTQTPIGLSQMQSNGADIRFGKDCNATTTYNYWIESGINTASTVIWVKIDTLPASGSRTFYLFYGNSSAAASSAVVGTFYGPHSTTDSVASGGSGGATNSQRGFRFAPTEDILITAVGKREPNGSTRYVTLFNFATQAIVLQSQVSGPAAQYSYSNISNPIWLIQGTQYVLELYQGPSDGYYFGTSSQIGQHLTYLDMRYCNSCTQNTFPTNVLGNYHYGYPDMWYFTKLNLSVAPTVTIGSGGAFTTTSAGASFCAGDSATISVTASGGSGFFNYAWTPASGLSDTTIFNPMASPIGTTAYLCTVTDQCFGNPQSVGVTVTVNQLPAVAATATTDSVCMGSSVTLFGAGTLTYTWNNSVTDGSPFAPVTAMYYTVTGTDINGCSDTDSIFVDILSLPSVTASTSDDTVCAGSVVTLNGAGASSYNWTGSVTDGVPFAALATTMYTVTGIDLYGCSNMDSVEVFVNTNPVVLANSSVTGAVCAGTQITFTGSGANTYVWDSPITDGVPETVTNSGYVHVTGTDLNGCVGIDSVYIDVNALPVVGINFSDDSICAESTVTLSGTGASTYSWTGSVVDGTPFTPTGTTTYTVTGTDAAGCSDTEIITVFVFAPVNVTASGPTSVCSTDGSYVLTGSPAGGTFSGTGVSGTSFVPSVAGAGVHAITYSFTDVNGCTNSFSMNITVDLCIGVAENQDLIQVNAYPNPFEETFTVELNSTQPVNAMLFNSMGQMVMQVQLNPGRTDIYTAGLADGIYILQMASPTGMQQLRIVKQR